MEFGQDACLHCGDPEREIEPDYPEIKRSDRGDAICDKCGESRETFDYRDLEQNMDEAVVALRNLDQLMQGLKDENPESIELARNTLHQMVDDSSASQLWVLLVSVKVVMERHASGQ
jgi:hypothetical protein